MNCCYYYCFGCCVCRCHYVLAFVTVALLCESWPCEIAKLCFVFFFFLMKKLYHLSQNAKIANFAKKTKKKTKNYRKKYKTKAHKSQWVIHILKYFSESVVFIKDFDMVMVASCFNLVFLSTERVLFLKLYHIQTSNLERQRVRHVESYNFIIFFY